MHPEHMLLALIAKKRKNSSNNNNVATVTVIKLLEFSSYILSGSK